MDVISAHGFLATRKNGVLATIRSNGYPQLSNITYSLNDGVIHISVTDSRAKTRNLRRTPRASLHITSENFWEFVVVEAEPQLSPVTLSPDDATAAMLRQYYRDVAGEHDDWDEYDAAMIAERRLIISMPLTHVYGQLKG
jgi:PPOX class probable F420-dependent enzyme